MFGDVIVPLDGSSSATRAIQPAIKLAQANDSKVHIVAFSERDENFDLEAMVRLQARLLKVSHVPHDISIEPMAKGESAADLLTAHVAARPSSLICMVTHGRGRSQALFGSVASQTLRNVQGPIVLVGPSCQEYAFQASAPLVVPVDGSPTSETILPVATAWSIVFHAPLHIVSSIDPARVPANMASTDAFLAESNYVRRAAADTKRELGRPVDYDVLHDRDPATAIVRYAADRDAGLICMATHGQTGLSRLLTGSVTSAVVRDATCPVLVLRPPEL